MEKGMKLMRNGKKLSLKSFMKYAKKVQPDLDLRLKAYKDLKERELVAKTGFKFGSHFRVYRNEPLRSHAPYLVHVVPKEFTSTWTEISRSVRLAHSVRKRMLFARIDKEVDYISIERTRP
jgi:tRNA-intron endonuclease